MAVWRAKIVDRTLTDLSGVLDDWTVGPITYVLNEPASCTVTVPLLDPDLADLVTLDGLILNELLILRDGAPFALMVPVAASADLAAVTLQMADPLWYLTKRHVGQLYDTLSVQFGNFESPHDGQDWDDLWSLSSPAPAVAQAVASPMLLTDRSLQLDGASAGEFYAQQLVTIPATTDYAVVTVSAWHYIPSAQWTAPAAENRGLWARIEDGTPSGAEVELLEVEITDSTPRDTWYEVTAEVEIPAHAADWTVRLRLHAPHGRVFWDWARVHVSTRLVGDDTTQEDLVELLVDHAQDTAIYKADVGLTVDTSSASGVARSIAWEHAEHANVWDAISEIVALDDGIDVSFAFDVGTGTRQVVCHYPRQGTDRTATVTLEHGVNFTYGPVTWDAAQAASSIGIMRGGGPGPAGGVGREHGWSRDDAAYSGLWLEEVVSAQTGIRIDSCVAQAVERVRLRRWPVVVNGTWYPTSGQNPAAMVAAGDLEVGDVVALVVDAGWVSIDDDYRITRLAVNPANDAVDVTLIPWPPDEQGSAS